MKKNLFLLILLFCVPILLMAQEKKYYCEARCYFRGLSYVVYLDFGDLKETPSIFESYNKIRPVDEQGKYIIYTSAGNFLNWMADKGWNLDFKVFEPGEVEYTVYTFSKITSRSKIKEGIILKGDK